jgi:hypothetical protein
MLAVPEAALTTGAYEHGWSVHQVMAHVAAMEFTYRRLPDVARDSNSGSSRGERAAVDIDSYNARQVERRSGRSVDELVDEFVQGRARLLREAGDLDGELLQRAIRSSAGTSGSLATVMAAVAGQHVRGHVEDFVRAAGRRPGTAEQLQAAVLLAAEEAAQRCESITEGPWRAAPPEEWSPAAISGHVAELLPYWSTKIVEGVREPGTVIGRSLDAPERLDGPSRGESSTPADAGAWIRLAAAGCCATLGTLSEADWSSPVATLRFGTAPARQVAQMLVVEHLRDHVEQLQAVLRSLSPSGSDRA